MRTRKQVALVAMVALLAATLACTPQDAAFQVNRTVAAISTANLAMASSVIQLNGLGKIDNDLTNQILNYNRDVATTVKASVVILQSGKQWNVIAPQVLALLRSVQLPPNVATFVKQPAVDVGVQALVAVIQTVELLIKQSMVEVQK
jgi:hypothetical protein